MTDFVNQYGFLLVAMTIQAILALSLYLPLMAGQLSLASPGFYALGGYIAAIISTQGFTKSDFEALAVSAVIAEMLLAALVSAVLAVLVGGLALRLRGVYLALATIAFVEIVRVLSLNVPIMGGAVGIFGVPQPFTDRFSYILISAPLLIGAAWFVYRLEQTRVGRAFAALREDELAASAIGVNPTYYKVLAFVMGAMLAGAAGALSAHFINTWNARQGTFDFSILILAYVIIGGSRTYLGAVVGGLLLTALPEVLRNIAGIDGLPTFLAQFLADGRFIIYGLLLALGTLFFPQGLIKPGMFKRWKGGRA